MCACNEVPAGSERSCKGPGACECTRRLPGTANGEFSGCMRYVRNHRKRKTRGDS